MILAVWHLNKRISRFLYGAAGFCFVLSLCCAVAAENQERSGNLPAYTALTPGVWDWLVKKVPAQASVWTDKGLTRYLRARKDLKVVETDFLAFEKGGVKTLPDPASADFALMDFDALRRRFVPQPIEGLPGRPKKETRSPMRQLRENLSAGWVPYEQAGSVVLFTPKSAKRYRALFEILGDAADDKPYMELRAVAGEGLELTGITMSADPDQEDLVRFEFYWKKTIPSNGKYAAFFRIVTTEGKWVQSVLKPLCYGLFPYEEWPQGVSVKESYSFVIPDNLNQVSYEIHLGVYDEDSGKTLEFKSARDGVVGPTGLIRLIALDAVE